MSNPVDPSNLPHEDQPDVADAMAHAMGLIHYSQLLVLEGDERLFMEKIGAEIKADIIAAAPRLVGKPADEIERILTPIIESHQYKFDEYIENLRKQLE